MTTESPFVGENDETSWLGQSLGLPRGWFGFLVYTLSLLLLALNLPRIDWQEGHTRFVIVVGTLAIWRYSWGGLHFIRAMIYRYWDFPRLRRDVEYYGDALLPPHVYFLVTAFRIEAETQIAVFKATIEEAMASGIPCTIVASIVELGDEFMVKEIFRSLNPPERVVLDIVRIPGTGKRDGLAQGYRAISRMLPVPGSVVAVIDGDSVVEEGLVRKCATFFKLLPNLGALTTDEECAVKGSKIIREWHHLRFAQRQIQMSSMGLSRKVLTLTGRMSMFRADIIVNPAFIEQVEKDAVDHWRLGRFKFLTGDDKSSWYWVLKNHYDMLYVPDLVVWTVEHPPSAYFVPASTQLMFRWFGNMLRTNGRALALGPWRTGLFTWWCLLDQRISMWTSITGPVFCVMLCLKHGWAFLPVYIVWIGFTRWVMTLMLLTSRPALSWYYPFLIYYNQIYGSLIKTYVFFRLDRQSWTRQKTKLNRGLSAGQEQFIRFSSAALHTTAMVVFVSFIGLISGAIPAPTALIYRVFEVQY